MNEAYLSACVVLVAIVALGIITFIVPQGAARVVKAKFWVMIAGAVLVPLAYVALTYRSSESPALWVALGGFAALTAGAVAYLAGLFTPISWGLATHALIPLLLWTLIAGALYLAGK